MLLGCIADDLTGATDLALTLTREGLRVVQSAGCPPADLDVTAVDAVVVALKSRTIPAERAVAASREAAVALQGLGAKRLFFKYCSTFDSTDAGNIGPVAEALLELTHSRATIACPAFPRAGRTVYAGYLFVNGVPLDESPMRDHPLTPMRDANLVRVLRRQTACPVGLIDTAAADAGPAAMRSAFDAFGPGIMIADAISDAHLRHLGAAFWDLPLITGGSGVAIGLPAAYARAGLLGELASPPQRMEAPPGHAAILAGSCSTATRRQVAAALVAGVPGLRLDPLQLAEGRQTVEQALAWIDAQPRDRPIMVYSSDDPGAVGEVQRLLGRERAGAMIEDALAAIGSGLPSRGFTRLIVAGGETSGAVCAALDIRTLAIGPEIDPGVPWTRSTGMALALKSGNFGGDDFFLRAWTLLS